jgi:hypothetical protein
MLTQYILRLTAAAILCGIVSSLAVKKGAMSTAMKMLLGIFMTVTVVSPWAQLRLTDFQRYWNDLYIQTDGVVAQGENLARQEMETIIKDKIASYILDKAAFYGAELNVEVRVDGAEMPIPCGVRIDGSISPYGRTQLQQMIVKELGIAMEDQIWTS